MTIILYYGTRLSENISKREPEGYLLCLNVPVARTGTQEYLPEELGLPPTTAGGGNFISVLRPEDEVFSPEAVASFEGMPVTNDHPPDGVDIGNIRSLQKGHAHNVRRGTGRESDLLLADLIITDPGLIGAILGGKREISCGYTYELHEENGTYIQRKIRGNHVAVVDAGRAGSRVSIKDHKAKTSERRKPIMKKSLTKILARMAKDGDVETVAEILEEMIDPASVSETPETMIPANGETVSPETQNIIIDEDGIAGIIERLDRIIELLTPVAADEDPVEELSEAISETISGTIGEAMAAAQETAVSDPVAEQIAAVMEEVMDPVSAAEGQPDGEENPLSETLEAGDALRAALTSVRPMLACLPEKRRRKVAGDIAARLRKPGARRVTSDRGAYAGLESLRSRMSPASAELGRRIMEKRNPAYKRT